jgi:hypothetical protein
VDVAEILAVKRPEIRAPGLLDAEVKVQPQELWPGLRPRRACAQSLILATSGAEIGPGFAPAAPPRTPRALPPL